MAQRGRALKHVSAVDLAKHGLPGHPLLLVLCRNARQLGLHVLVGQHDARINDGADLRSGISEGRLTRENNS